VQGNRSPAQGLRSYCTGQAALLISAQNATRLRLRGNGTAARRRHARIHRALGRQRQERRCGRRLGVHQLGVVDLGGTQPAHLDRRSSQVSQFWERNGGLCCLQGGTHTRTHINKGAAGEV
jgi:hypothetical protein